MHVLLAAMPAIIIVASACGTLPSVPNPFAAAATPTPEVPTRTTSQVTPTAVPSPTPMSFQPFWVQNYRITEMWNGPSGQPNTVSFGATSAQFCSFLVVLQPDGDRLYVFNPYTQNYLWIDAADVGPVDPPEQRTGPKPEGNCSREIYSG